MSKSMRRSHSCICLLVLSLAAGTALSAQDPVAEPAPGGFDTHGEVTVGYRFTDIAGYRPQYLQLFDLKKGFRVQDFTIQGKARNRGASFADGYSLSASGLGGEPFATASLKIHKTKRYDFRAQWRQSYYYWNQNDNVVLPISSTSSSLSTGLTANHDWATVRKLGSASFTYRATDDLRFTMNLQRTTTDGSLLTTRSLEFFNAPSYWAAFARANPYPLNAPLRDEGDLFTEGVDYSWREWDFHYQAGYQWFREETSLNLASVGEVSINPVLLSTREPLNEMTWSQTRQLRSPISDFSFRGNVLDNFEWRGGYSYAKRKGPATLDMNFSGIAPTSSAANPPLAAYRVMESGRATVSEPNHIANQGFTWKVKSWWAINADYRYSRYTSESEGRVQSVFNGGIPSSETNVVTWKNGLSDLDFNMVFTPLDNLTLRPGVRFSKSDIATFENGVIDGARTLRTKHARPEFRFGYTPWSKLSFRGGLHSSTSGASYNAITPHTRVAANLVTRIAPKENLSIENSLTVSSARLEDSNYRNRVRSNTITVSYAVDENFSAFGSVGYESFFAQGNIVYARGTSPLTSVLRDQEIHRIFQAGFDVKPVSWLGVRMSANYDRLTGQGEIVGEPPSQGPLTWPLATGTLYFDLPKAGRFWLDFQRTYYIEEIVTANNFSANLLTIRFTKTF
jgi:hypothetical protein